MLPFRHLSGISVGFCIHRALATPLPFYGILEGSTYEEELTNFTSSVATGVFSEYQTTPGSPAHVEVDFLKQVEDFLLENMLLILVVTILVFILILIICGAVFMSRRRKVNAYYPSSFPSKMYVDHRDRTGGAKPFKEVPEKTTPEQSSEAVDSHRQLQDDIMKASRNLRTPSKPAEGDPGQTDDHPEERPEDSVQDEQIQRVHEDEAQRQRSDTNNWTNSADKDDTQEPLCGSSVRPPSLHIHMDSATLQLMAGEKTAF